MFWDHILEDYFGSGAKCRYIIHANGWFVTPVAICHVWNVAEPRLFLLHDRSMSGN
jgi:hypothetical protein